MKFSIAKKPAPEAPKVVAPGRFKLGANLNTSVTANTSATNISFSMNNTSGNAEDKERNLEKVKELFKVQWEQENLKVHTAQKKHKFLTQ